MLLEDIVKERGGGEGGERGDMSRGRGERGGICQEGGRGYINEKVGREGVYQAKGGMSMKRQGEGGGDVLKRRGRYVKEKKGRGVTLDVLKTVKTLAPLDRDTPWAWASWALQQTNKPMNKRTNKQTNKRQTNKRTKNE